MSEQRLVLLTGATGYIGGRLLPLLEQRGERVRCLSRKPSHLRTRATESTEIVQADLFQPETLEPGLQGVDCAYYLVHSMGAKGSFEEKDRKAAENFATAARKAGVKRIIYLGGLGEESEDLSAHLRSRHEVGEILRTSGCQVMEFRASIVIGSGSLSFELIRALVEKLPVMICPKWVRIRAQPIAVEDLLDYLIAGLDHAVEGNPIYEVGGPEPVSYGELMQEYARQRGLKRYLISVPVLTPRLSSLWLGLVTPVYAKVGRKLIDGLKNPTIVKDDTARHDFDVQPRGVSEAIARALVNEDERVAATRWSDALSAARGVISWGGVRFGNRIVDSRTVQVSVGQDQAFRPIQRIGGQTGWYYADFLWSIRGWIDLLWGGVGLRRARRDPDNLHVGDVLDWWRVEQFEPGRHLCLQAEMKVPGRAWLEFDVDPKDDTSDRDRSESERGGGGDANNGSVIRQTAIFDPVGFLGLAYWYSLYPLHALIFRGMLNRIAREAEQGETRNREIERAR